MKRFLQLLDWLRPPRFATYRPAPRLGTRRVEHRLLRRLTSNFSESERRPCTAES